MITANEAVVVPVGTRVRIHSKGTFSTFFEGHAGFVTRVEQLHMPAGGFACYVCLDDYGYGDTRAYFAISRDLDILLAANEQE